MDDDRVRWVPPSKQPDELISLEQARQLLVDRISGFALGECIGDCSATMGWRDEFVNMRYGGSVLKAELGKRAEKARVKATQAAVRDWIAQHLAEGALKLYKVEKRDCYAPIAAPLAIDELLPEFWQSSKRGHRTLKKLILERNEDPSGKWWYALDRAALMALLDARDSYKVQSTPLQEPGSVSLDEAIERVIKTKGHPPHDILWKIFCNEVRNLCGVNEGSRGYGDRTIQNRVKERTKR
jgi:hypothetical protein